MVILTEKSEIKCIASIRLIIFFQEDLEAAQHIDAVLYFAMKRGDTIMKDLMCRANVQLSKIRTAW